MTAGPPEVCPAPRPQEAVALSQEEGDFADDESYEDFNNRGNMAVDEDDDSNNDEDARRRQHDVDVDDDFPAGQWANQANASSPSAMVSPDRKPRRRF